MEINVCVEDMVASFTPRLYILVVLLHTATEDDLSISTKILELPLTCQ